MSRMTILYSELAEYSVACFRVLVDQDVDLQLVHWPVNSEAPFKFDLGFCKATSRDSISDDALLAEVQNFNPEIILASGWMDKGYLKVCRKFSGKIPTVLSLDNHWYGTLKQRLATLIAPFTLLRSFSHAYVPGRIQKEYALRLGFAESKVFTGFYSADSVKFKRFAEELSLQTLAANKRFIYLGRYVEHKGVFDMWEAFTLFRRDYPDWELWCVGTGDQFENRVKTDGIKHFGFVQPSDLLPVLKGSSVYILPSHFEPWGVSVHEMAICGFPMILSNQIGSKEAFLDEGKNGFSFAAGDSGEILKVMRSMAEMDESEFVKMGERSRELGRLNSPKMWSEKLLEIIKE